MSTSAQFMRAQVVYRQGVVKDFIAPSEMTVCDFASHINRFGKVRLLRSLRLVDNLATELTAGGVTFLPGRR